MTCRLRYRDSVGNHHVFADVKIPVVFEATEVPLFAQPKKKQKLSGNDIVSAFCSILTGVSVVFACGKFNEKRRRQVFYAPVGDVETDAIMMQ